MAWESPHRQPPWDHLVRKLLCPLLAFCSSPLDMQITEVTVPIFTLALEGRHPYLSAIPVT